MKKSVNSLYAALITLALVHPDLSAAEEGWESQWYGGVGLGISRLNPDSNGTIYEVEDDSSGGYKLTLGYDWSEKISVEGYYADLGEAGMSPWGKVEYQDLGVSGLYHFYQQGLPHRGLEAFAKVGFGYMNNESDLNYERVNDTHLMFGLGAGYGFANGLMLRADLDLFDSDSQFFSINLLKRFGGSKPAAEKPADVVELKVEEQPQVETHIAAISVSDSDADGVQDVQDDCPETLAGAKVEQNGCATTLILQGVIFEHDSNLLAATSKMILDNLASQLISQKMQRRIQVVGHTDAAGPAAYNQKLSKKRAEAVHDYLVSQGVDAAILSAVGKGELQPIADNTTDAGRAENRRVELHWE